MTTPVVENFLAHYGVKGMKWGVRRKSGGSSSSSSESKPSWAVDPPDRTPSASGGSKKGKKTEVQLSPDAQVFNALRQKAKEGGIQALSNDEIRVLTARASAMDQYARTFPKQKSKKQKVAEYIVKDLLVTTGKAKLSSVTSYRADEFLRSKNLIAPKKQESKKRDDD